MAVNPLLTTADFDFMLRDLRAQGLVVSKTLLQAFEPLLGNIDTLRTVSVDGGNDSSSNQPLAHMIGAQTATKSIASTRADDVCFWLSSGSTGAPKGTVHLHSHLIQTTDLYGRGMLSIVESDGTTGQAVPGYLLRIVGDDGKVCGAGDIGEL